MNRNSKPSLRVCGRWSSTFEWTSVRREYAGPKLKAVAQDYEDRVSVFKITVDDDSPVFSEFEVEVIPTLLFFKGSQEISRLEGMASSQELDQQFKASS